MIWVRKYKPKKCKDVWEYHIKITCPDGTEVEERKKSDWDEAETWKFAKRREAELFKQALKPRKEAKRHVPTLSEWHEPYMLVCAGERMKSSTLKGKRKYYRRLRDVELDTPDGATIKLGDVKLDAFDSEHVTAIKLDMIDCAPKTVNNVLDELRALLNIAVQHKVITHAPVKIVNVKYDRDDAPFHTHEQLDMLLGAVADEREVAVLLGAHAGLRNAEICALLWSDIDFEANTIRVLRTLSKQAGKFVEGSTKSRKGRTIPMSKRLATALRAHRHLRGPRVLYQLDGSELDGNTLASWVREAEQAAGLEASLRPVHALRHTFCSHLALAGKPVRVIQELAGHHSIVVTQKYMHLAPSSAAEAIAVFDAPRRDIRETASPKTVTA